MLENSYHEAVRFKAPLVGTEHILIAIIRENDCVATRILNTMGVSVQKIYVDLFSAMGEDAPAGREDAQTGRGKKGTPVLDSYSRDLTALAPFRAGAFLNLENAARMEQALRQDGYRTVIVRERAQL